MPLDTDLGAVDATQAIVGGPTETAIAETFVNALVEGKALADDGALYSTVQGAENAASSWVFVPPTTFSEAVTVYTAGLTLVGAGYDSLIDGGSTGSAIKITANNVTVADLSVKADAGTSNSGIHAFNGQDGFFHRVTVRDAGGHAFGTGNPGHVVVNCRVERGDDNGIYAGNQGAAIGCIVENACQNASGGSAALQATEDSVVMGCIALNSGHRGINPSGNDCIVIGNRVHGSGEDGININGTDTLIANNRVSGSAGTDIRDTGTSTTTDANVTGAAN